MKRQQCICTTVEETQRGLSADGPVVSAKAVIAQFAELEAAGLIRIPKPVKLSASGRAIGFIESRLTPTSTSASPSASAATFPAHLSWPGSRPRARAAARHAKRALQSRQPPLVSRAVGST